MWQTNHNRLSGECLQMHQEKRDWLSHGRLSVSLGGKHTPSTQLLRYAASCDELPNWVEPAMSLELSPTNYVH